MDKRKLPINLWQKAGKSRLSLLFLALLCALAIFAPTFIDNADIPYSTDAILKAPFSKVNGSIVLAGTDHLGRNVFHQLILGLRTSLLLSVGGMLIILLIGTFLGMFSGYYENKGLRIKTLTMGLGIIFFIFAGYWLLYLPLQVPIGELLWTWLQPILVLIPISIGMIWLSEKYTKASIGFPLDHIILKTIEIVSAFPFLLLILAFLSFFEPSMSTVMVLIISLYWTEPARLVRGQVIKIRQFSYITSGHALGFGNLRIMLKHILPEILPLLAIVFCTGVGSLIMLEATLSYLGIGMPPESPSLGKIISSWRYNVEAWWLAVFPAVLLCSIVLALKKVNNYIRQ